MSQCLQRMVDIKVAWHCFKCRTRLSFLTYIFSQRKQGQDLAGVVGDSLLPEEGKRKGTESAGVWESIGGSLFSESAVVLVLVGATESAVDLVVVGATGSAGIPGPPLDLSTTIFPHSLTDTGTETIIIVWSCFVSRCRPTLCLSV